MSSRPVDHHDRTATDSLAKAAKESDSMGHAEAKDSMNDLPPGWTKRIKLGKKVHKRKPPRTYTTYIEPTGKYIFGSRMDVSRYLQTGNIKDCKKAWKTTNVILGIDDNHVQPPESKVESCGEAIRETNFSEEKIMLKPNIEDADKHKSVLTIDTSADVNNKADAIVTEQMDVLMSDTDKKTSVLGSDTSQGVNKKTDAIVTQQMDFLMSDKHTSVLASDTSEYVNNKADAIVTEQTDVLMSNADKQTSVPATLEDVNNKTYAILNEQMDVLMSDKKTSVSATDTLEDVNKKGDAIATEQMDVLTSSNTNELKPSYGADPNVVEQIDASMADVTNVFIGASDVVNLQESDPDSESIFSGLNLDAGAEKFDLSSAESALRSLYGESERDTSIEFAVNVLLGETPLTKEAEEIEKFFSKKMEGKKSEKGQSSKSAKEGKPPKNKKQKSE